jgi:hypothetical protein
MTALKYYKCTKEFSVNRVDEYGQETSEYMTATRLRTSTKKDCASFPKKRQQPEIQTGRGIVQ